MSRRTRRKVVKLKRPGPPAPCREMPAAKDGFETVTRYHHWQDELAKRRAQHLNLDEALLDVVPPGGGAVVRPSDLMYSGLLPRVTERWDQRWWTARLLELSHFAIGDFLASMERGLSCRRERGDRATALARYLGWRVHTVIQQRYQKARLGNRVSLDNRVYTLGRSEQLARLAQTNPRSEYGTLHFALAGTRADIIDLTRREVWEIKPAALASEAVLQLWAYIDNHETARVFDLLVEDGAVVPPLDVGDPSTLPPSVLEEFTINLRGVKVPLAIQPYTVNRLPGLILYTVGVDIRQGRQAAAAAIALGRGQANDLLVTVGRSAAERREAAIEIGRMGQYAATGTAVACAAVFVAAGVALAAPGAIGAGAGAAGAGATGAGAGAAGAGTAGIGGQVIRLLPKALEEGARAGVRESAKRAAASVIITTANGQFRLPPETVGPTLDTGVRAGTQLAPRIDSN